MSKLKSQKEYEKTSAFRFFRWLSSPEPDGPDGGKGRLAHGEVSRAGEKEDYNNRR